MPLALLAIGSSLDADLYEFIIVDGRIEEYPLDKIARHLNEALCGGVTLRIGSSIKDGLYLTQ